MERTLRYLLMGAGMLIVIHFIDNICTLASISVAHVCFVRIEGTIQKCFESFTWRLETYLEIARLNPRNASWSDTWRPLSSLTFILSALSCREIDL